MPIDDDSFIKFYQTKYEWQQTSIFHKESPRKLIPNPIDVANRFFADHKIINKYGQNSQGYRPTSQDKRDFLSLSKSLLYFETNFQQL